jgi:1-deoxy-D-xylulose-5-phosphate reductoisomerase
MKGICILGATGSIGVSTLDVVARHADLYNVVALTANNNIDLLYEQCLEHHPEYVVVVDEDKALTFTEKLKNSPIADIRGFVIGVRCNTGQRCFSHGGNRWCCGFVA